MVRYRSRARIGGAARGRVSCELVHSGCGDRHGPCPLQVLIGEEKDPATGEVPVADTRARPLRLGSHITSRMCGYRMLGAEGMYTGARQRGSSVTKAERQGG